MGNNIDRTYKEQEKAIGSKKISFELNIYFIGEEVNIIYERFKALKENNDDIYSFWNYYYHDGEDKSFQSQKEGISKIFKEKQEKFKEDPKNSFKEVVIVKFKERNKEKIEEIFETFASEKSDVYCPFIIFFFDDVNNDLDKVVPDEDEYYISPMKVSTFKFDKLESDSTKEFHKHLLRICSYYNELGEQFLVWTQKSDEPYVYDLIDSEFNSYINIFCLGKTGSGKSTFLNKFFGEKKCKQGGTGLSTTSKIVRFGIDKVPIRIYDIPGFEDEKTINIVNDKLIQISKELNSDKDKIHLILYFIDYNEHTVFYGMENKIIETLKTNNKDIRIIFIMTHSTTDPYELIEVKTVKKKKKDNFENKLQTIINVITSVFGSSYSYETEYFQKNSLIQKNIIFTNLEEDYEHEVKPFGFDKVIKAIYNTLIEGNDINKLRKIREKLSYEIINKIKNDEALNKEIEENLSNGYLFHYASFSLQKEKAIKEAEKLYNGMFTIGMNLLAILPIFRDVKIGALSYHKKQFKKQLNRIFGFNIENPKFDSVEETEIDKINSEYLEKKEIERINYQKKDINNEINKDCIANEVSSSWIFANEAVGYVSFICLFGGPVLMPIGAIGTIATSVTSYQQFKTDCKEYFEQYKKHFEDYKYYSLFNFINSIIYGIEYFENYIMSFENKAAPSVTNVRENMKKEIQQELNTTKGNDKSIENENEIRKNIPYLN